VHLFNFSVSERLIRYTDENFVVDSLFCYCSQQDKLIM